MKKIKIIYKLTILLNKNETLVSITYYFMYYFNNDK